MFILIDMKKCVIAVMLVLCVGCASTPKTYYHAPPEMRERMGKVVKSTLLCIEPSQPLDYLIGASKEPNAYLYENEKIIFSEGMFLFDDSTLTFVMAHEIAHSKLNHIRNTSAVSYVTTGAFMVLNAIVPGAGYLNHIVNPAVVSNYSKSQELDADSEAAKACIKCMGISKEAIVDTMIALSKHSGAGGSFWSHHPSWSDRIKNIRKIKLPPLSQPSESISGTIQP